LRVTSLGTKAGVELPVPHDLHIDPPRPNPFRVMTAIGFDLPSAGRVPIGRGSGKASPHHLAGQDRSK
jgi:hypothetical protein